MNNNNNNNNKNKNNNNNNKNNIKPFIKEGKKTLCFYGYRVHSKM